MNQISAQAARRGIKGKKNSADLAAPRESVGREFQVSRRKWIETVAGGATACFMPGSTQAAARPNVILIMTDDHGYGDLSLHGNPHLKTPNLDKLAAQGVEFTRFYVSPVCAPTRSSLLTGRYNIRCGVHGVTHGHETMPADETTIAEALHAAGYRTALHGKWHLGEHYPYVPHAQGFDEFIGFRTGHWMDYFDSVLERNGKPFETKGYITDALTNESIRFIESNIEGNTGSNPEHPFFLYLAYNAPHSPFQVPDRYFQPFKEAGLADATAAVYGMVTNLDENVGRLLSRVDELGIAESTVVVFLTDNGPNGQRYNAGLRGTKGSVYEGGVRVPFFARWKGRFEAGKKVDTIAAHIDVYPTLLEICGVAAPKGRPVDGCSIAPLLTGKVRDWPDRMLFTHRETEREPDAMYPGTVRTQRFNLVNGKELYDLSSDPGEQTDVAGKYPAKVNELREAYENWFRDALGERGFSRFPIPVGYPEENPVTLAAPQSYFSGGLKFHGGPGYAHDWISGWTSTEDQVYWDIDVVRGGKYEVGMKYLCPKEDVGSTVSIGDGNSTIEFTVDKATPMSRTAALSIDPTDRYEIMKWAVVTPGTLNLVKGRTKLTVKALKKTGETVMDLKEVILKRLE